MKCVWSRHIKKKSFNDTAIIMADIEKYNRMVHKAFKLLFVELKDGDVSIHMQIKKEFKVNDYFAGSTVQDAKAIYRSQLELKDLYRHEIESKIKSMNTKIKQTERRLKTLNKEKTYLIKMSKSGKEFKNIPNAREQMVLIDDKLVFKVKSGKNKYMIYDNPYLFEVQYLDPEIKKLKARIRNIELKIQKMQFKLMYIDEIHVCFGTKSLFKKQWTMDIDHNIWLRKFRKKRYHSIRISGRCDAVQGNFVFRYNILTHELLYRSMSGKDIIFKNVEFPYGQELVDKAVSASNKDPDKWDKISVAWSIEDWGNSFIVKCMIREPEPSKNNYFGNGCVGIDMNYDCIALSEVDGSGNMLNHKTINFDIENKTSEQIEHIISKALDEVFDQCIKTFKPLVMEDISNIKNVTQYKDPDTNRKTSIFAYRKMQELAESKSNKFKVGLTKVNPAYTSIIGKIKYLRKFGLTIHESASFVIARRGLGCKEKIPAGLLHIMPSDKINKHHWKHWAYIYKTLKSIPPRYFYNKIDYYEYETLKDLK